MSGCLNGNVDVDFEKVIILSLLHDTIEDTDTSYDEIENKFGKDIAESVMALTKNEKLPKNEQISTVGKEAAIVKLADRIFNLKDVPLNWDINKVDLYREEAVLILKELGFSNEYMANRLKKKIDCYKK